MRKAQAARPRVSRPCKARDTPVVARVCWKSSQYGKLSDCQSTEPAECEVFIVEGDSAGGFRPRAAGDPRIQAILPIRGKILNVEKARLGQDSATKRSRRSSTCSAPACRTTSIAAKLRYHKIVLMG